MTLHTLTLHSATASTIALAALIVGHCAPASAKVAYIPALAGPSWISTGDSTPRLFLRPVHTEAFAGCEWVRVRAATGIRWRALCN